MGSTGLYPNSNIEFHWCSSVKQIDVLEWETIFGKREIKSYNLFMAMEEAGFADVDYYYLKISNREKILSIIPCFGYRLDIIDLLVNKKLRDILNKIRKIAPDFLKLKTFVAGSYAATCEGFIEIQAETKEEYLEAKRIINLQLKEKGKELKSKFVFIKDVRENQIEKVKSILDENFCFFSSFPTTLIPVGGKYSPYPGGLRKKYRQRYKRFKKLFDNQFHWEIVPDFSQYTELLGELYFNVLRKAKNRFEVLNADFFANINKHFSGQSFLMVARDKESLEIRLMTIVLEEEDRLLPLYLGIKYKDDDTRILYLNTIFKTIETAETLGKELIEFGQTSYDPKVRSGAFAENIYYGFSSPEPFMQLVIKHIFKYMFMPPAIPSHSYMEDAGCEAVAKLRAKGFSV